MFDSTLTTSSGECNLCKVSDCVDPLPTSQDKHTTCVSYLSEGVGNASVFTAGKQTIFLPSMVAHSRAQAAACLGVTTAEGMNQTCKELATGQWLT